MIGGAMRPKGDVFTAGFFLVLAHKIGWSLMAAPRAAMVRTRWRFLARAPAPALEDKCG
jgi:hypothetical protein